jgi:hypothetical protein
MDNIKMDLREIGRDGMKWIYLAHDRDQWRTLEHFNEPSGFLKCCEVFSSCTVAASQEGLSCVELVITGYVQEDVL